MVALILATCTREFGALLILSLVPCFFQVAFLAGLTCIATALYLMLRHAAMVCPPQPILGWEKFFGPTHKVAMHCLKFHGWRFLNPLATWGLLAVMAAIGATHAPTDVLRLTPMIAVAWLQPLLGSDFERLQSHAWPAVIALAVCV